MALSEAPALLETDGPERGSSQFLGSDCNLPRLCVFIPPSSGDPKALERAPAFDAFAAASSSSSGSSESGRQSTDFSAHGEGVLWAGDSCPTRPSEWSNEEYAAALERLRRLLLGSSGSSTYPGEGDGSKYYLSNGRGLQDDASGYIGTPPSRNWRNREDGRRRETPGGVPPGLEQSRGVLTILTQDGFRLLYALTKCFACPPDSGDNEAASGDGGFPADGDGSSLRRAPDLQAAFLQLVSQILLQIAGLVEALPGPARPDGHGPTLRFLCARQQGGLSAEERRRRALRQGADGDEDFLGEISYFGVGDEDRQDRGSHDGIERAVANGQSELAPALASLLGRGLASVDTVLEAARVLRSLLLCGAFFVDWLVDATVRDVEEARGGDERETDHAGRGRGRRFAASVRSRQKGDGLGSVRSTRGIPANRGKRRKNEQMEVDFEETSPGVPTGFDEDEELAQPTEKRDKRPEGGRGAAHNVISQLTGVLRALSGVALSSAAWRAFDSDFGGEKKEEERQRFYLLRALMRPLHVLYDEEKMKSQASLQALFLSEDNLGEKLKAVVKKALVALLETIETRREKLTSARREMKRKRREEEDRKRQAEKEREREDIMRDAKHGVGGTDEEAQDENEERGASPQGKEGGGEEEDEGAGTKDKPEEGDKEADEDDDEEEEGQLSWRTQLHSILLQPECKALVEVLTSPSLRRRRLPALVLRELTQQLKEQLLLCGGGVDKATAAQKKSFACAATSLESFASLLPRVWLNEKLTLLQLFAADAYHIRKALLECLKALLLRAHRIVDLEEDEEDDAEGEGDATRGDTKTRSRAESARDGRQTTGDDDALGGATAWGEDSPSSRSSSPPHKDALTPGAAVRQRTRAFWSKQRASLIHELLLRLDDRTPLARSWALKVLADLIGEQEALPTLCVVRSVQKAVGRLLDKSTLVRSAAVGVFSSLIHLAVKQQRAGGKDAPDQPFLWLLVHGEDEWALAKRRVEERQAERRRREAKKPADEKNNRSAEGEQEGDQTETGEGARSSEDDAEAEGAAGNASEHPREEKSQEMEIVDFEELAVQAEEALSKAIDICRDLLFSRSEGDQKAALRFLVDCCLLLQLRRRRLLPALQQALRLAFSRSAAVADLLLLEFYRLFLEPKELEEQQVILRDHWALRCNLQRHEALAQRREEEERPGETGGGRVAGREDRDKKEKGQRCSRDTSTGLATKRAGLLAASTAPLRPLEKLLLHTEISPTVNGAFRFGAGRLLELIEEGDMASLACIEKLFVLALSKEGGNEHRAALKKAADALFALAMQPNFLLGRDATPRCALGLLRLLFQASKQTKHSGLSSSCELPSLSALSEMSHASLLRRNDERSGGGDSAEAVLHKLSNGQLLALQGALVQQLKKSVAAGRETRLRASGAKVDRRDEGVRFLIAAELCRILAASLPDRRTTKAAGVALEAIMAHYGTTDPNWFSAAQAVIDVTFAHCGRPEHLWSQLLAHLLSHLLRQPSVEPAPSRPVGFSPAVPSPVPASQRSLAPPAGSATAVPVPPSPCRLPPALFAAPPSLYHLAHLVFLAGHVALRICILLEKQQSDVKHERSEMQRRAVSRSSEDARGEDEERARKAKGDRRHGDEDGASEDESGKGGERAGARGKGAASAGGRGGRAQEADDSSEMQTVEGNMGMQTREEEEAELFTHIVENQIVGAGLLGRPLKRLILVAALEPQRLVRRPCPSRATFLEDEKAPGQTAGGVRPRGSADGQENLQNHGAWTPLKRDTRLHASQPFPNTPSFLSGTSREDDARGNSQRDLDAFSSFSALQDTPGLATLHAAAVIALCKFATISRTFCESRICKTTSVLHALISLLFSQPRKPLKDASSLSEGSAGSKKPLPETPRLEDRVFEDTFQTPLLEKGNSCGERRSRLGAETEMPVPCGGKLLTEGPPGRRQTEGRDRPSESGRLPSALRQTLLVCYGDLTCRHPNVLELYNDVVFNILQDEDVLVRHAGVQVFTHLVMNGMVKPKGRLLVLMLQLMRDPDARIRAAAEIFFCEVDRKGSHAIVNSLPELLGAIAGGDKRAVDTGEPEDGRDDTQKSAQGSHGEGGDGRKGTKREEDQADGDESEDEAFEEEGKSTKNGPSKALPEPRDAAEKKERKEQQRLVTFLLQFVKQHRHSEALIEKLCQRIALLPIPKHVIDSASPSRSRAPVSSAPLSPSSASSEAGARAGAARRVYFQAISAVCLSSPNLEKALRRLSSSFPLIRFAVAAREEGGGEEILRDLLRRVSIKIAGRWGANAALGGSASLAREGKLARNGEKETERSGTDRVGSLGGAGGGAQDVAVIREVVEELQKKLQAATDDATEKGPEEGATLAERLGEIGEGEEDAEKEGLGEGAADAERSGEGDSSAAGREEETVHPGDGGGEGEAGGSVEALHAREKKRKGEEVPARDETGRREKKRREDGNQSKTEEGPSPDSKRGARRRRR
uniref:Os07g0659500 protein, related n=1 Tax=Neospora caninum (strain Liverpool) TaxID=572307 RepID=A0A0F7UDE0_NEOCL|nr:TPA: Os07g0659500 protein, related [Neospora caninum Liverpool]